MRNATVPGVKEAIKLVTRDSGCHALQEGYREGGSSYLPPFSLHLLA